MSDAPYYILSIDGRGIYSVIATCFLKTLEYKIQRNNPSFRLADFFDMYAGASVGGYIIAGLCYNKLSGDQLHELMNHESLAKLIKWNSMPPSKPLDKIINKIVGATIYPTAMYNGATKTARLKEIFGDKIASSTDKSIIIPAFNISKGKIELFDNTSTNRVSDILDAASAVPLYFPIKEINSNFYIDGGIICNNPTITAITTAIKKLKATGSKRQIRVLSIGAGICTNTINCNAIRNAGAMEWLASGITTSIDTTGLVDKNASDLMDDGCYLRINGSVGNSSTNICDISPENIKNLESVAYKWVDKYMSATITFLGFS